MKRLILTFVLLSLVIPQVYSQQNKGDNPDQRLFKNPVSAPFISEWDKVPSETRNMNSFKRFEWFYRSRLDARGDFPKEFIEQQKQIEMRKVKNMDKNNVWTNIGPLGVDMTGSNPSHWGVNSGRIRGLAIHPTNPDIVYIGAAAGGIWKTTNGGVSWVDKSGQFNLITFGAIAIDPVNTNIIYAGTGETKFNFNMTTFEGDGLYKSINGGDNWTKITDGFGSKTQFSDIVVSPANSNIVLASIGMGNFFNQNPDNVGLWRSTNAGINWTRVSEYSGAFNVAFHPTNGNIAYASFGNNTELGFVISTNAGVNWDTSNTGLPDKFFRARFHFDISRNNPSVIYGIIYSVYADTNGMNTMAYKSTNSGASWFQISAGENIAGSFYGGIDDQGSYDLCVAAHPLNPLNAFFGNVELSKTINGSAITFSRNPAGPNSGSGAWDCWAHVDIHIIKYAPSNPNIMYVGCDGGVYKSTNGGTSFFHVNNGINTIQFYSLASHPTNPNVLYGGAQDNGNFRTVNKGATNWLFSTTGDGMECFVDYSNADRVFISTQKGGLHRSTNAGVNWSVLLKSSPNTAWVAPFWQHPSQPNKIFAALSRRIARSTNSGDNWVFVSPSLGTLINITSVAQSPVNTDNMIAVLSPYTINPEVFVSTNEGVNFSDISANITGSGLTSKFIQRVVADPFNGNTFYAARTSFDSSGQVIKTTNLGADWIDISSGLPPVSANTVFADPVNAGQLYAGTDFGVYRSLNGGTNWVRLGMNIPYVPVLSFSYFSNTTSRYLRAGTHGRGAYELDISGSVGIQGNNEEVPAVYSLSQNFPNPFNPVTKINYNLSKKGFVSLKVYDILGKEVATLVNESMSAGKYSVSFDASNFSSGVYFYKLEINGFSDIRKMLLVK
ncbi:MAG: T9SS type A sorting domain-containing protein [Ignavibacteriae bacterium]|nr:T9SS type A sorting domain-containing protein [Ignavibacteriota bacterium]